MESKPIERCPGCGSEKIAITETGEGYFCSCIACGGHYRQAVFTTPEDAKSAWNLATQVCRELSDIPVILGTTRKILKKWLVV